MNILFLSVSNGEGHIKAAEAINEFLKLKYPESRTVIIDALQFTSPMVNKLVKGLYFNTLKNNPGLYGIVYKMSETDRNLVTFSRKVNKLLSNRLASFTNRFSPSVIVCTHAFALQMASSLKQAGKINVPLVAVLTDFTNHNIWRHENVDAYVVAHECVKQEMESSGMPRDIIHTYGIPVSSSFLKKKDKSLIIKTLGLDNKLTLLVMGGSLGIGNVEGILKSLLECKEDLQVIAVTGRNYELYKRLKTYALKSHKKAKVVSYTNRVADFMEAADIIVTKPGGMTVSEALVKELPILITSPIPGQEERNAHFLINSGVAARVLPDDNIDGIISQIVNNPFRLKHMKEMARYLSKPNSARDIVSLLESLSGVKQLSM